MNIKNLCNAFLRQLYALSRPSKAVNLRLLRGRGERVEQFVLRDAVPEDIPALAELHAIAWAQTYPTVKKPPTAALRAWQWAEQFKHVDGTWFCLALQGPTGSLVGFVKGKTYAHANMPAYDGELNKMYLLKEYQRLGFGKKMLCVCADRFMAMGIKNMLLFAAPENPSCWFYEAMGGQRLYAANGDFDGGYGWPDLHALAAICKDQ
jgi:ribosomal protein S18 acetylase RimI-like enzyme